MSFNTIGSKTTIYGGFTPIWLEVEGVKQAGGSLKAPVAFATDYPTGTVIPAGTPVYLAKSGGDLIPLQTFELAVALAAGDTKIVFKNAGNVPQVKAGQFLMLAPATYATTGTAYTVPAGGVVNGTNIEIPITAGSWGTANAGDVFVVAKGTGASQLMYTTPNGLLWHDIIIEDGDFYATGAVVFDGSILVDRTSPIPACVKTVLSDINFEKES